MPKCSYCRSSKHIISQCDIDEELVNFIMDSHKCPKFDKMSLPLLKRINVHCGFHCSVHINKLVDNALSYWENKRKENICSVCYEELEYKNSCVTKCNHRFCLDCMLQSNKICITQKKEEFTCPMCREVLITYIGLVRNNSYENIEFETITEEVNNTVHANTFSISNLMNIFRFTNIDSINNIETINEGIQNSINEEPIINMRHINTEPFITNENDLDDVLMNHFTNNGNIHSSFIENR